MYGIPRKKTNLGTFFVHVCVCVWARLFVIVLCYVYNTVVRIFFRCVRSQMVCYSNGMLLKRSYWKSNKLCIIHRQNNAMLVMWCFFAKSRIFGNMRNKAPSSECSRSRSKHLRNTTYATKNYVFFFVHWIAKMYWSSLGSYGCCFNLVLFFFFILFFLMMYACMPSCMYVCFRFASKSIFFLFAFCTYAWLKIII